MKKKKVLKHLWFLLVAVTVLNSCNEFREVLDEFPEAQIVYQRGNREEMSIGFINADGTNRRSIPTDLIISRPLWSRDGNTILFIEPPGGIDVANYPGRPSVWIEGEGIRICKNRAWPNVSNIAMLLPETRQALIINGTRIQKIEIEECKELKTLVKADDVVYGASISSDRKKLVYSYVDDSPEKWRYVINILDLETKDTVYLAEGINPMWSPDNEQIIYTSMDGIYIIDANGKNTQKVISYSATWRETHFEKAPPAPQWSPDGNWIIYHKCSLIDENCMIAPHYSIYKYNINSEEEVKIVDEGMYPYWRH